MSPPRTRVLVVDDSAVIRRLVSDIIASDPTLEVAGTAPDGRIALAKIPQVNPDLITLDVEMPEMDGLETLRQLRRDYPRLPVIMLSSLTQRGASVTLDSLYLGANDYVTKPSSLAGDGQDRLARDLLSKIKVLALPPPRAPVPALSPIPNLRPPAGPAGGPVRVVAVGASTGGPNALTEFLAPFPRDFPVPVLIVQHMPPLFTRTLADRLTAESRLVVREAVHGEEFRPGHAWIAPGDFHMEVARTSEGLRLNVHQGPPEHSCRPAVDVLFRSLPAAFGSAVLAVVLTGMGQDGMRGCERIRDAGGSVLAQDASSSVVWGMPGCVSQAGLAERTLPPALLGLEAVRRAGRSS